MAVTPKDLRNLGHEIISAIANCNSATPVTEFDHSLLCDPTTSAIVIATVSYSPTGVPTTTFYNLDGTPYVGLPPIRCSGVVLESDPIEGCASNVTYFQWVVKDNGQPTGTVYYTDTTGALVPAPLGFTIGACNQAPFTDSICLCDNNGGVLTSFVRFYTYNPNTDSITFTGDWLPDLSATYTPTGIVGDCGNFGNTVTLVQRREDFSGVFVWNRPANQILSLTIKVRKTGVNNNPTITDNAGAVSNLFAGDVETWGAIGNSPDDAGWLTGNFTITSNHVDTLITILYTEYI